MAAFTCAAESPRGRSAHLVRGTVGSQHQFKSRRCYEAIERRETVLAKARIENSALQLDNKYLLEQIASWESWWKACSVCCPENQLNNTVIIANVVTEDPLAFGLGDPWRHHSNIENVFQPDDNTNINAWENYMRVSYWIAPKGPPPSIPLDEESQFASEIPGHFPHLVYCN